jgi:hypothetical protein
VDRIRAYQDGVLHTLMESLDLKDRASLMTRVERHRQIYSFGEDSFSLARLRETLDFLRERAQFDPEVVELVGWPDFHRLEPAEMAEVKRLAQETRCKLWLAGHSSREDVLDDRGLPPYIARHADRFSVIIGLEPERNLVRLRFLKTHDQPPPAHLNLVYDPATQLLRWR